MNIAIWSVFKEINFAIYTDTFWLPAKRIFIWFHHLNLPFDAIPELISWFSDDEKNQNKLSLMRTEKKVSSPGLDGSKPDQTERSNLTPWWLSLDSARSFSMVVMSGYCHGDTKSLEVFCLRQGCRYVYCQCSLFFLKKNLIVKV